MPRLGKKAKIEWGYYIGGNGRRQYNALCRKCRRRCRQSFRAELVECRKFEGKRKSA